MITTHVSPIIPDDEIAARTLTAYFQGRDVTAFVHWDRSPWGVRIPLTDDNSEYAPALYVLTENAPVSEDLGGRRWFGQLGGCGPDGDDGDLVDTTFEWLERSWLGDNVAVVARAVGALLPILKAGVAACV